ncbi:MAG: hypothetical protein B7Z16_17975 [Algoriphagus sp. 32-45-6]|jgi:hypothetical protein|nr:MAG: hypothetical protein B7Z16_17975 [Algoriphagus sp. 32-45-6]
MFKREGGFWEKFRYYILILFEKFFFKFLNFFLINPDTLVKNKGKKKPSEFLRRAISFFVKIASPDEKSGSQ